MKILQLQFLILLASLSAFAQTPQKFSYQAVAINPSGTELKNTPVCIRASILKESISGIEDWIEVHPSVTTDAYGLFTIEVGAGNQVGGALNSFSNIKWGDNKFFLRIEMSLNSQCSNFALVGTNQLLSVPYAIYAERSATALKAVKADTASFANAANTANTANTAGKANSAIYSDTAKVALSAVSASVAASAMDDLDKDPTNELQKLSLAGDTLSLSGSNSIKLMINDADNDPKNELQELTFENNILGLTKSTGSTIDFSNLPNFNASGSDLDFPQGITGAKYVFKPDTLTVPDDQVFYVTASEDEMFLPGVGNQFGRHWTFPHLPIFKPGTKVSGCRCIGFYKPLDPFVEPLIIVLKPNEGNFYQVPYQKNFVVKSGLSVTTPITLDGHTISPFGALLKALVIPEGVQIRNLGNDEIILTGYLVKS
jgi:hypothetical protein